MLLPGDKDYAAVYVTFADEVALLTSFTAFNIFLFAAYVTDTLGHGGSRN
jgi:hypothetical protein